MYVGANSGRKGTRSPCAVCTMYLSRHTAECTMVPSSHGTAPVDPLWAPIHQPSGLACLGAWCLLVIRTVLPVCQPARSSPSAAPAWSGLVWSAPSPPGSWTAQKNTGVSKYPRPGAPMDVTHHLLQPPACLGPPKPSSSSSSKQQRSAAEHSKAQPSPAVSQIQLN